jgi:hypothetical protein
MMTREFHGFAFPDGRSTLDAPSLWREFVKQLAGADGNEFTITAHRRRKRRSLKQNAWLHAFLQQLAEHWGYTVEELKTVGLSEVFGTHVVMGVVMPIKPHTSELSTSEMCDLCEWFIQKAAEDDVLVLYPDEFKREKRKREKKAARAA